MNIIKRIIGSVLTTISPSLNIKVMYFITYKKRLPLKNPKTLCEKILYLRINEYNNSSLVAKCANKVDVREFVKKTATSFY